MPTTLGLPVRPRLYSKGSDLNVGVYHVVSVVGNRYTVQRTIGLERWFPLTSRDNPAWRTWPSFEAANEDLESDDVCDWPHWGRA